MLFRVILTILFLPALMSCGRGVSDGPGARGEFEVYFQKFEAHSAEMGRSTFGDENISITFAKLNENEAGRCEWHFINGRRILIDPDKWATMDDSSREPLIHHELGHCLLRREHEPTEARIPDTRTATENPRRETEFVGPKSIMNPTSLPGVVYNRNRDYYLKELFGRLP